MGTAVGFPGGGTPLGTAAWEEVASGGSRLFVDGDTVLGWTPDGRLVGHKDGRNVLVVAGPRSGKGTSFIVPQTLVYPGSMVINDPKGENALVTARARGNGSAYAHGRHQRVGIFDPFGVVRSATDDFADLKVRFNPLSVLDPDREESVLTAREIGDCIVLPEDAGGEGVDWRMASSGVIAVLSLHATSGAFEKSQRNLATVRRLLIEGERELADLAALNSADGSRPSGLEMLFRTMMRNRAYGGVVAEAGAMYLDTLLTAPKQLTGMLFAARNSMGFLDDAATRRAMSASDFSMDELKTNPKGMTLYMCLPQRYMGTHNAIIRLMTMTMISRMEELPFLPRSGHPIFTILDEFAGLRRMKSIEEGAAQINAHGVKLAFIVQSLAQLKEVYRENWETLMASCGTKLFFNNEDHFTREYVSKLVGETEVVRRTQTFSQTNGTSRSTSEAFGTSDNRGESLSETRGKSWSFTNGVALGSSSSSFGTNRSDTEGTSRTFGSSRTTTEGRTAQESETLGYSDTVHKRPLLNPDEVGRMFGDAPNPRVLVLRSGSQPLALFRRPYFALRMFDGFHDPHPHHPPPRTLRDLNWGAELKYREQQRALEAEDRWETLEVKTTFILIASIFVISAIIVFWSTIVWVCQWLICIALVAGAVVYIAKHPGKPQSAAEIKAAARGTWGSTGREGRQE